MKESIETISVIIEIIALTIFMVFIFFMLIAFIPIGLDRFFDACYKRKRNKEHQKRIEQ